MHPFRQFSHEKLDVYQKMLACVGPVEQAAAEWERRHAIADHLPRSGESMLINLAEACRRHALPAKQTALDYAMGSTLECAACLDVAEAKSLIDLASCRAQKRALAEIVRMLIGLRKSWAADRVREESPEYSTGLDVPSDSTLDHEQLDVYVLALSFNRWFATSGLPERMSGRLFRKVDAAATGMVLNIAEGNGRYAELDRDRFRDYANRAAVRSAPYLDLCVRKGWLSAEQAAEPKSLLVRVADMTAAMMGAKDYPVIEEGGAGAEVEEEIFEQVLE